MWVYRIKLLICPRPRSRSLAQCRGFSTHSSDTTHSFAAKLKKQVRDLTDATALCLPAHPLVLMLMLIVILVAVAAVVTATLLHTGMRTDLSKTVKVLTCHVWSGALGVSQRESLLVMNDPKH